MFDVDGTRDVIIATALARNAKIMMEELAKMTNKTKHIESAIWQLGSAVDALNAALLSISGSSALTQDLKNWSPIISFSDEDGSDAVDTLMDRILQYAPINDDGEDDEYVDDTFADAMEY